MVTSLGTSEAAAADADADEAVLFEHPVSKDMDINALKTILTVFFIFFPSVFLQF
jgi:hypothetical protein